MGFLVDHYSYVLNNLTPDKIIILLSPLSIELGRMIFKDFVFHRLRACECIGMVAFSLYTLVYYDQNKICS